MSMSESQPANRAALDELPLTSDMALRREWEISRNAPIGPQRLADDTIVVDKDGWYRTLTPSSPWPASNEALFSNLDERNADAQIDEVVSEYQRLGLPVTWCAYPWTRPQDLGARLLARGATQSAIRAFLCSSSLPLAPVEGVEVEQVDPNSGEAYDTYINLMSTGFDLPEGEKAFRRRRYHQLSTGPSPCMRLFIARRDGIVAGCQALVTKSGSGHLTGGYILPAFRAYGVFQSLIAAGLRALRELGIPTATGHSNETSAFWVDRFGFKTLFTYSIYQLDPPSAAG